MKRCTHLFALLIPMVLLMHSCKYDSVPPVIIYTDISPDECFIATQSTNTFWHPDSTASRDFDVDADGAMDIRFTSRTSWLYVSNMSQGYRYSGSITTLNSGVDLLMKGSSSAQTMNAGEVIDPDRIRPEHYDWNEGKYTFFAETYTGPNPYFGEKCFVFRITGTDGSEKFGWIRISAGSGICVKDYAVASGLPMTVGAQH